MADNYIGWKMFDTVTIVSRPITRWNYETHENIATGECQGFLVDPKNKKQLESALSWGTSYEYEYATNEDGKKICTAHHEVKPEQYTYDNKGFTLELSEAAEQSSQGGKLSFWNCWITAPDGKRFLIGIAANLLLDVLKSCDVKHGVVQEPLMFARCKGGVGMLSESMNSYKDAVNDEYQRKNKSTGKTTKHKIGYVYETLTQKNVYLGDFYKWYEPVYEEKESIYYPYRKTSELVGFKKLNKPVKLMWFPAYYEDKGADYYLEHFSMYQCEEKLPARKEANIAPVTVPELDDCVKKLCQSHRETLDRHLYVKSKRLTMHKYIDDREVGISTSATEYTMPIHQRELLLKFGYRIED